jgi:hypothetical protein
LAYAPAPRINIWATAGAGIFDDFITRYKWSTEIGNRYFFLRKMSLAKKKNNNETIMRIYDRDQGSKKNLIIVLINQQ